MGMLPRDIIIATVLGSMMLILLSALIVEMRVDYAAEIELNDTLSGSLNAAASMEEKSESMEENLFGQEQEVSIFTLTLKGVPAVINLFRQSLNVTRTMITEAKNTISGSLPEDQSSKKSPNILFTGLIAIMVIFVVFKIISAFTGRGDM